jgi:hypothetical protein
MEGKQIKKWTVGFLFAVNVKGGRENANLGIRCLSHSAAEYAADSSAKCCGMEHLTPFLLKT